jgi:putative DNA primase/helicase
MTEKKIQFLDMFPDHVYRYIDQTGERRPPVSSLTIRKDLNENGYEAYFTVNGFKDTPDCKKENCSSLNAFFVDIDGRKSEEELDKIKEKIDPSFILETKNGYHIYWLLDEPIYKEEVDNWDEIVERWERIEQSIVIALDADPVVKDLTRILRIPDSYYWKKTGDAYKKGLVGATKIKGLYKKLANTYTMDQVEEIFPVVNNIINYNTPVNEKMQKYADGEKKDFFDRVQEKYPMEERPSFQKLISGEPNTLPVTDGQRNHSLLIVATLMRQAGWSKNKALKHIESVGWHGIEKEKGGSQEIMNTINSAYGTAYTFSYKNEVIAWNMTQEEQMKIQSVYTEVAKARKEVDKVRFYNYEKELLTRYPYLRKNEIGIVFNYHEGVYKMMSDLEVSSIVLNGLYDDMLWNYRTKKNVADKVACLLSIIPNLDITNDHGRILNVKNGLLDIYTRELRPHTPNFVSLIQSPVMYMPYEKAPTWEKCMESWMKGPEQEEKTILLKQFSGYCLSSSMQHDRALFLVGDGGNGKSTFVDTISMVVGKEATSHIDLEGLYSTFGMAGLIGKRLNVIEEVPGNYYQSNKLKKLISGEAVTIDMKYKPQFTFRPQAKFIFAVNQMPRVDDTSTATERRICVAQFLNNFRDNPNTSLRSEMGLLAQELPGILNWMLDGIDIFVEMKKFIKTQEQTQILSEYRQENSSVEGFIGECLEFNNSEVMTARDLYEHYKTFCIKDGRKFKGSGAFVKEVKAFGVRTEKFNFIERKNGHNPSKFEGIKISEESGIYQSNLNGF